MRLIILAVLGGSCARAVSSSSSSSAALLPYHHAHPGFLDASAFPSGDGTTFRKRAARLLREARAPALAAAADARALAGADGIIVMAPDVMTPDARATARANAKREDR